MPDFLKINRLVFRHCGPVDLVLDAHQCMGISGTSGSGKSLLLRAIADLDQHDGQVLLEGQSANDVDAPQWRQQVALLPAESQWWFDTIGEHFDDVDSALLEAFGFDEDVMSWSVSRMSSGEKQRLALLRLLNNHPRVLLLDEPTANLDQHNSGVFEGIIQNYLQQQSACAIWVSHDPEQLARVAQVRYTMQDGQLEREPR